MHRQMATPFLQHINDKERKKNSGHIKNVTGWLKVAELLLDRKQCLIICKKKKKKKNNNQMLVK